MRQTRFTEHALERVGERLHLSHKEVAQLLDQDMCVALGKDGSSNRVHKLFYSEPDSFWFVAVQDAATGEVITVISIDQHHRWKVSGDALSLARAKACGEEVSLSPPLPISPELVPVSQMITLRFVGMVGNKSHRTRAVGLGRMRYELEQVPFLYQDLAVRDFLKDQASKELLEGEYVEALSAYWGKSGHRKYIEIPLPTLL